MIKLMEPPVTIDLGGTPFSLEHLDMLLHAIDNSGGRAVLLHHCLPHGTNSLQLGLALMAQYDKYRSTHEG